MDDRLKYVLLGGGLFLLSEMTGFGRGITDFLLDPFLTPRMRISRIAQAKNVPYYFPCLTEWSRIPKSALRSGTPYLGAPVAPSAPTESSGAPWVY